MEKLQIRGQISSLPSCGPGCLSGRRRINKIPISLDQPQMMMTMVATTMKNSSQLIFDILCYLKPFNSKRKHLENMREWD